MGRARLEAFTLHQTVLGTVPSTVKCYSVNGATVSESLTNKVPDPELAEAELVTGVQTETSFVSDIDHSSIIIIIVTHSRTTTSATEHSHGTRLLLINIRVAIHYE